MIDIYVYIERERGTEVERKIDRKKGATIERERERERERKR